MTDIFTTARAEAEARHRESVDFATRNDWWTDFRGMAADYQWQPDPALREDAASYMRGGLYDPATDAAYLLGRALNAEQQLRHQLSGIIATTSDAQLIDMTADAYRALHDYIHDYLMPIHNRLMDIYASRSEDAE